jgi:probable rRNA maturation factor
MVGLWPRLWQVYNMEQKSDQLLDLRLDIQADGRYKFDRKRIRKAVFDLLESQGIAGQIHLSLTVVGDRKMADLRKRYLKKDGTTDVLSFSQTETKDGNEGKLLEEEYLMLGDVVVSYPQARRQAVERNILLDEEIEFLSLHGVLHLLGIHHD